MNRCQRALAVVLLCTCHAPASAGTSDPPGVLYALVPFSNRNWGCHPPCLCPDNADPASGSFRLVFVDSVAGIGRYRLDGIDWIVDDYGSLQRWIGSGEYRVGGGSTPEHQLVLDLEYGGHSHHYDSGLVPGGDDFPRIAIGAAMDLDTLCFHDIFNVIAETQAAGVPALVPDGALRTRPNPFRSSLAVEFSLSEPAAVSAWVFDVTGRRVKTIADGAGFTRGAHRLVWDGRRDGGAPVRPGRYRIRLRAGERTFERAIVKLE